jgi:phosphonate transport system permease protein
MGSAAKRRLEAFDLAWRTRRIDGAKRGSLGLIAFLAAVAFAVHISQFEISRLIAGMSKIADFLSGMVPPLRWEALSADLGSWYWGLTKWLRLLWTTVMIALFGTAIGTLLGGIMSFYAARNLGARSLTIFVVRRALEVARTVPDLVWALIFLFAFGLGPLAGVLAILIHTLGAQGKLFAEVNENADMRPLEGVRSSGGAWSDEIAVGLLPQVLPNYVSYTLWRFETNMRSATIIGFVGAGGIGMELYEAISLNYFDDTGAMLVIVFVAVALVDMVSEWLRLRIAGAIAYGD